MDELKIFEGFSETERERVVNLYHEAFGRKFRPAFADDERCRSALVKTMRGDRFLVATKEGQLLGVCGFHQSGVGSIDFKWSLLKGSLSLFEYLRAVLVLSVMSTSESKGAFTLDGIAVDAAARGEGVGTALLKAAAAKAKEMEFQVMKLSVVDNNPRARALYERLGFRPAGKGVLGPLSKIYGFKSYITMELELFS